MLEEFCLRTVAEEQSASMNRKALFLCTNPCMRQCDCRDIQFEVVRHFSTPTNGQEQNHTILNNLLVCVNWKFKATTDLAHDRLSLLQKVLHNEFTSITKQFLAGMDVPGIADPKE